MVGNVLLEYLVDVLLGWSGKSGVRTDLNHCRVRLSASGHFNSRLDSL